MEVGVLVELVVVVVTVVRFGGLLAVVGALVGGVFAVVLAEFADRVSGTTLSVLYTFIHEWPDI